MLRSAVLARAGAAIVRSMFDIGLVSLLQLFRLAVRLTSEGVTSPGNLLIFDSTLQK
jgi:hypothetical protein